MNRAIGKSSHKGFTLVELMVGMLVGLIISAAAVSAFVAHTRTVYQQMSYNQAAEDVNEAYAVLSRLMVQSLRDSLAVSNTESGGVTTQTSIDLELPEGFAVWPNDAEPFTNNWVRIAWTSSGNNANRITVANAASSGALGSSTPTIFAGGSTGNNTRITMMDLLEDNSTAPPTYTFVISGKSWARDQADGNDSDAGMTVEGRILPRN